VVKKVSISASEAEANLNGSYPIFVAEGSLSLEGVVLSNTLNNPLLSKSYVNRKFFYLYEIKSNPDEYILPLDIVTRPINSNLDHYAVYLGNKQVAELPGYGLTQIISWSEFCNPSSSSSGFSSSSSSGSGMMGLVHSRIPFKRKEIIVKHIDKAIRHGYGLCGCHTYNSALNNCENLVNA
jgi:hypothetical protein